jgi:NTE family protein
MPAGTRMLAQAGLAALVAACAGFPENDARAPGMERAGYRYDVVDAVTDPHRNDPRTLVLLAFSGGGTRAAAMAYGVLE